MRNIMQNHENAKKKKTYRKLQIYFFEKKNEENEFNHKAKRKCLKIENELKYKNTENIYNEENHRTWRKLRRSWNIKANYENHRNWSK